MDEPQHDSYYTGLVLAEAPNVKAGLAVAPKTLSAAHFAKPERWQFTPPSDIPPAFPAMGMAERARLVADVLRAKGMLRAHKRRHMTSKV